MSRTPPADSEPKSKRERAAGTSPETQLPAPAPSTGKPSKSGKPGRLKVVDITGTTGAGFTFIGVKK